MKKIFIINYLIKKKSNEDNIGANKFDKDLMNIFLSMNFELKIFPMTSKRYKVITLFKIIYELITTTKNIYFFRYPFVYLGASKRYLNLLYILYEKIIYIVMKLSQHSIAVIISDLDFIRYEGFSKNSINKEINLLKNFNYIIVHNENMARLLENNGIKKSKIVNQEIGNNLSEYRLKTKRSFSKIVIFSGNLSKSYFLNKLLGKNYLSYTLNLYGIGFSKEKETSFLKYKGSYSSEDIVKVMEGSWGLIWDGDDINKCSGLYGEYTRINNPSKFSQYIAAGLPVIAWKEAAVANVIKKYKIGFVVENLIEIGDMLNIITEREYQEYINNVLKLREKVVTGYHFKRAIEKVIDIAEKDNEKRRF